MLAALRQVAFRRLATLYTLNALTEWVASVALMVVVYDATRSTIAAAVMLICKQVIPGLLVDRLAGGIDRLGLRRTLVLAFGASSGALLGIAVSGVGPLLFLFAGISGLCGAVVRTALRAGVARSLTGDDLRGGNALLNVVVGVAAPTAPALAALAVTVGGSVATLVLCAFVFAVLVGPACLIGTPSVSAAVEVDSEAAARREHGVRLPELWLLLLGGVAVCASAMTEPSLLAFSEEALGAGVAGYGAICTAWALGVTVGSLLFTRVLGRPMLQIYVGATVLSGLAYLAIGLAPTVEFAVAAAVVGGVGTGMDWVAIVTAVQERAAVGAEARAAARLESFAMAGPAVGILIGGLLAELVSARLAIIAPGLLSLGALGVLGVALLVRTSQRTPTAMPSFLNPPVPGGHS